MTDETILHVGDPSLTGYVTQKCRCAGCRQARQAYDRANRARKNLIDQATDSLEMNAEAAAWVRVNHPAVWQALVGVVQARAALAAVTKELQP